MPGGPVGRLALAACLAALAAAACGPGDPPGPAPAPVPPGDAGGGDGAAGGGSGDGGGAGEAGGVATAWSVVRGGDGDEWVQDVAAAPRGAVVALTAIGPREGRLDEVGLVQLDGSGQELWGRTYAVGATVRFPRGGALSVGPGNEVYLALACAPACGGLGAPLNGSALVQVSASGDPRWVVRLAGEVASQPVVDPAGNVAVAASQGGANVVRSFDPGGALRWEVSLRPAAPDVALAADAGGNVLVGRGSEVTRIRANGAVAWSRAIAATVTAIAGTSSEVVVAAGRAAEGPAVLLLQPDGSDGPVRTLPGGGDVVLVEVGTGRRIGAVTSPDGCGATVTALEVDGGVLWSRPVAAAECGGSALAVHAVTVTTDGVVVVGGALRGALDLGRGRVEPQRTDGFLAAFGS